MALSTGNNSKVELLAPAGNMEKLTSAVHYGADAVYFGGEQFNLRDKAGKFSSNEIADALAFCRKHRVKTTFLLNSFLHEKDIAPARAYINLIKDFPFDAIMISDPGMWQLVQEAGIECPVHLSTQMSTLNHLSINFWHKRGIKRIVLARETTLDEIKMIRNHTDAEIEIFAHGALCISYSGRCLLSRYLSGRDANQGACAHPCRWKFSLIEEKREGQFLDFVEHAHGTEILSSKDLCLLEKLPLYIEAGVNAFKLEGRMKSLYYAANVTRIYRQAIDAYYNNENIEKYLSFWKEELDLISHRPYTDDLFNEFDDMGFHRIPYIKKVMFLGRYAGKGKNEYEVLVRAYNPIRLKDEIEAIFPITENKIIDRKIIVEEIFDNDQPDTIARPGRTCLIRFNMPVPEHAIFRKRLETK